MRSVLENHLLYAPKTLYDKDFLFLIQNLYLFSPICFLARIGALINDLYDFGE